ncbi:glycoside hydrolase, partial [Mycena leptocephala]
IAVSMHITPFTDSDGNPSDVSEFSKVLNYIAIMAYDINGPWSAVVGPNAPLNGSCALNVQSGSVASAVNAWNTAGMPLSQIVLGVPSYGHSFRVSESDAFTDGCAQLALYPPFNASDTPAGDAWDDLPGLDECGNLQGQGGLIDFWGMVQEGYLNADGTPATSVPYLFDNCTQTPYVYNRTSQAMVSFDNAQSFGLKGDFIKSQGLGGFAMWEAGGDFNDILLDAIRESVGYS